MKSSKRSTVKKASIFIVLILLFGIGIQFVSPTIKNPPVTGKLKTPKEVTQIFERACYDCHSNETKLKWFDQIAPISWKVTADVHEARSRFNFSEWDNLSVKEQETILWKTVNAVIAEKMPLPAYATVHPEANISQTDIETLKRYVNTLHNNKPADTTVLTKSISTAKRQLQNYIRNNTDTITNIPVALNGVKYVAGYRQWQVISTTNRFDNNTMRVVYGNDITVKAIKENHINPFPDGAVIVKVVWNKIEDKDGNIKPGTFNAAQIMTKDHQRFSKTGGWGFAIFNGLKLTPTGKTPTFDTDCFNCHKLHVSETGYVFNVPLKNNELDGR